MIVNYQHADRRLGPAQLQGTRFVSLSSDRMPVACVLLPPCRAVLQSKQWATLHGIWAAERRVPLCTCLQARML